MTDQKKLELCLAILRLSLALFFLVWVLEKFVQPSVTVQIAEQFYGASIPTLLAYSVGVIQAVMLVLFVAGLCKTVSYGALLVMHAITVLVSHQQLLNPYQGINHLFHASIPVLGVLVVIFILRERDRLFTVGADRPPGRPRGGSRAAATALERSGHNVWEEHAS